VIGDASQHLPKFFANPCKAAFSPKFFTAKLFYHTVSALIQ